MPLLFILDKHVSYCTIYIGNSVKIREISFLEFIVRPFIFFSFLFFLTGRVRLGDLVIYPDVILWKLQQSPKYIYPLSSHKPSFHTHRKVLWK